MKKEKLLELLNQMTIEEKIGQMVQIKGNQLYEKSADIVTGPNDEQKKIYKNIIYNAGSILNTAGAEEIKKIQDTYLEKSRLKIPLIFMADIINGYKTIFPCPLAQGCSWNAETIKEIAEISKMNQQLQE